MQQANRALGVRVRVSPHHTVSVLFLSDYGEGETARDGGDMVTFCGGFVTFLYRFVKVKLYRLGVLRKVYMRVCARRKYTFGV